jgi:hypothetical protein
MMRNRTAPALVLAFGLLMAAAAAWNPAQLQWMRMHDSVVPTGSGTMGFVKPVTIVSVSGHRAGDPSGVSDVAAYHMIVTFAAADSVSQRWSSSGGSQFEHTASDDWWAWSGARAVRRSMVSRYDAVRQRVDILGRRFSLSDGNLFVVRYDEQGRSSIRQLARTLRTTDPMLVARTYQGLLPSDPVVAGMLYAPPKPCPQKAPAPGGGTA